MEGWRKREEENGRGMARRQEKKRAVPYSSDSNLDVNCRLMSRQSAMLPGNHSGIQENEARKKFCWTGAQQSRSIELSFYLRYLSRTRQNMSGVANGGAHTRCHTVQASSSIWNSGIEAGAAVTANS